MLSDAYSLQLSFSLSDDLIGPILGSRGLEQLIAMTPHMVDWVLLLTQLMVEFYYMTNGVIKPESFLMILLRCQLIWDILLYVIVICHDIPSYFMLVPLSEMYPFLRGVCTFVYFMHFFFSLFSLAVFSFMTYAGLQWPTSYCIWIRKSSFTLYILLLIGTLSLAMTVPMFIGPFRFAYNVVIKHWHYDMEAEPMTVYYRIVSMGLQGTIILFYVVCVVLIAVNYFELKKKFLGAFRSSTGQAIRPRPKVRDANVYLFVLCFMVLGVCFTVGTLSWNFITCSSFNCQLWAVLGNTMDRAKWAFYCLIFHLQKVLYGSRNRVGVAEQVATVSQAVPFRV